MKVVKVLWVDSCNSNMNWTVTEDIEVEPIYIDSFGVVVKDTDEFLAIAQNYCDNPEQYSNITTIPKGCIKEVFVIHEDNVCKNEQKPMDKVEPKFKVGDIITNGKIIGKVDKNENNKYHGWFGYDKNLSVHYADIPDVENWHLWTIQEDAKDGDVLKEDSCIFIIKEMKSKDTATIHCCLFDDGDFDLSSTLDFDIDSTKPATKEQRDTLMKAMTDAGYTFDFEKKELKKVEKMLADNIESSAFRDKLLELFQKFRYIKEGVPTNGDIIDYVDAHIQELIDTVQNKPWTKEDENMLQSILDEYKSMLTEKRNWLKSLKDRVPPQHKQGWNEEDKRIYQSIMDDTVRENQLNDKQTNWLRNIKYRYFPQLKPSWSEEELDSITAAINNLEYLKNNYVYHPMGLEPAITFLKSLKERIVPQTKQEWKQENTGDLTDFENAMMHIGGSFFGNNAGLDPNDTNAIKEQANILLELVSSKKLREEDEANLDYLIDFCNGYYNGNKPVLAESTARSLSNWLYQLKSYEIMSKTNKIDNEEAEKTIHLACEFIRHRMESNGNIGGVDYAELIKRLKSLRPQSTWKPSDEQITVLHDVAAYVDNSLYPNQKHILINLYLQLKKLQGE